MNLANKILLSSVVLSGANGLEVLLNGSAETFGKFGFDKNKYMPSSGGEVGQYPTDSYASMFGEININIEFTKNFKAILGGALNGKIYDSSTSQGDTGLKDSGYIGFYQGYYGDSNQKNRNYILHNAFLEFNSEYVGFKLGRYEVENLDWFNAFNQGGEIYAKYGFVKAFAFYSDARAMAYSNWFWDYSKFHISGSSLVAGGIEVDAAHGFAGVYLYSSKNRFLAPGFKIEYDSNPAFESTSGFRSKTTLVALFPFNDKNPTNRTGEAIIEDALFGIEFSKDNSNRTQSVILKQKFDVDNHNFGAMIYKNWGAANAWIGSYGDPFLGLDIWTGSIYDKGWSLSDMIGRNAFSAIGFVGGIYNDFEWKLLGRYTTSPRSDENSVALTLSKELSQNLNAAIKLEYFADTTKQGYFMNPDKTPLSKDIRLNRSHIMTWLTHKF